MNYLTPFNFFLAKKPLILHVIIIGNPSSSLNLNENKNQWWFQNLTGGGGVEIIESIDC